MLSCWNIASHTSTLEPVRSYVYCDPIVFADLDTASCSPSLTNRMRLVGTNLLTLSEPDGCSAELCEFFASDTHV